MSTMDFALRETQTRFYALDLKNLADQFSVDDSFNLLRLNLKDADADGSLKFIVSTLGHDCLCNPRIKIRLRKWFTGQKAERKDFPETGVRIFDLISFIHPFPWYG